MPHGDRSGAGTPVDVDSGHRGGRRRDGAVAVLLLVADRSGRRVGVSGSSTALRHGRRTISRTRGGRARRRVPLDLPRPVCRSSMTVSPRDPRRSRSRSTTSSARRRARRARRGRSPISSTRSTVQRAGDGTGIVTSTPAGIDCGSTCSLTVNDGTAVTLTATADAGSIFAGWTGACTGTRCVRRHGRRGDDR